MRISLDRPLKRRRALALALALGLAGGLAVGCVGPGVGSGVNPGADTGMDAGTRAPGVPVELTRPIDLAVSQGSATALVRDPFKLTGPNDYSVPAGSRLSGWYRVVPDDAGDGRRLTIDWTAIDNLGAGAARHLGRRPAFYTIETFPDAGTEAVPVLPAGSRVILRFDPMRGGADSDNPQLRALSD